jgi:hypothetical protein
LPLSHASLRGEGDPVNDPDALAGAQSIPIPQDAVGLVKIYGGGPTADLIHIEGQADGCQEYVSSDAHFMLLGSDSQVRIRCWFTKHNVFAISASQSAEGTDILPVYIAGGANGYSVVAYVADVRTVIHEQDVQNKPTTTRGIAL